MTTRVTIVFMRRKTWSYTYHQRTQIDEQVARIDDFPMRETADFYGAFLRYNGEYYDYGYVNGYGHHCFIKRHNEVE